MKRSAPDVRSRSEKMIVWVDRTTARGAHERQPPGAGRLEVAHKRLARGVYNGLGWVHAQLLSSIRPANPVFFGTGLLNRGIFPGFPLLTTAQGL